MCIKIHLIKLNAVLILSLLIIMIFHSCIDLSKDRNYTNYLSYFGDSLTSHFPKKYTSMITGYSYSVDTVGHFNTEELSLVLYKANQKIAEIKQKYQNNKIYDINDKCIIVVNDFLDKNNLILHQYKEYQSKFSKNCEDKYVVIPNFWSNDYADNTTKSKLDKNFKYIIIDSKVGENVYSSKINFYQSYMPSIVRHGYSKGIAFNEKEDVIIYWLVLW
jgi:hypothetical protein